MSDSGGGGVAVSSSVGMVNSKVGVGRIMGSRKGMGKVVSGRIAFGNVV